MSYTWNGKHNKGAMRQRRMTKRTEAEARNAVTPASRRRAHARETGFSRNSEMVRAAFLILHAQERMDQGLPI